ncbi:hypothetical protein DFH07DRAFT_30469 [Mycena maculata]|uniref:Transmembrane protein n=1 Tax=Mycena maculata TaxID=230809 RepID=A0AAD7K454_9AGAR|nr:hypothetical protein DFH07DRAFT_30469 [Mycena maculata]
MKPITYRLPFLLAPVVVSVVATPARIFPAASIATVTPASIVTVDVDEASTSFVQQQPAIAHCTTYSPSRALDTPLSPPATLAAPTNFLAPKLEVSTGKAVDGSFDEQPSGTFPETTSSPGPDPVELMRMGDVMVSPRVIFWMIFGFALFAAVNVGFFFVWHKCCCPRPRISVAVPYPAPRPARPSTQTAEFSVSRGEDDCKGDVSVRDSGVAGVEMLPITRPITRPKPARHIYSRPRVPLMDSAF